MKVGISINGVIRDLFNRMEEVLKKYYPPEENNQEIVINDYDFKKWIVLPKYDRYRKGTLDLDVSFDVNPDSKKDVIENVKEVKLYKTLNEDVEINTFIYESCALEIFGHADEMFKNAVHNLNLLVMENPDIEFILMSVESGKSVSATHFFLSKTSCMVPNIKFITKSEEHWNHVDVMVTDHPLILNSKPDDKISIKIEKKFNSDIKSDYTLSSIKDLHNRSIWDEIIHKLK